MQVSENESCDVEFFVKSLVVNTNQMPIIEQNAFQNTQKIYELLLFLSFAQPFNCSIVCWKTNLKQCISVSNAVQCNAMQYLYKAAELNYNKYESEMNIFYAS